MHIYLKINLVFYNKYLTTTKGKQRNQFKNNNIYTINTFTQEEYKSIKNIITKIYFTFSLI